MDRSLGFGSMPCNSTPCSDSVSLRLRDSHPLTSLHVMTRRLILQKARRHPCGLRPLAGPWFQVLFHSPPGVLFTFPSRYYALSVAAEYLALEGGPPCFRQDSSCPVVLRIISHEVFRFSHTGLSPSLVCFPKTVLLTFSFLTSRACALDMSYNPNYIAIIGLGSSHFARRYYGNLSRFLFLQVLRWFTSLRLSSIHY